MNLVILGEYLSLVCHFLNICVWGAFDDYDIELINPLLHKNLFEFLFMFICMCCWVQNLGLCLYHSFWLTPAISSFSIIWLLCDSSSFLQAFIKGGSSVQIHSFYSTSIATLEQGSVAFPGICKVCSRLLQQATVDQSQSVGYIPLTRDILIIERCSWKFSCIPAGRQLGQISHLQSRSFLSNNHTEA